MPLTSVMVGENARGCRIEHETARAYGLEIIYEKDDNE